MTFLSTPSARRATRRSATSSRSLTHFYPRPPRGGRLTLAGDAPAEAIFLSTPSARRATDGHGAFRDQREISIHALREEGDRARPRPRPLQGNFYPRPPRGGRHGKAYDWGDVDLFLSTPSARRATASSRLASVFFIKFLSTPSARRATVDGGVQVILESISIHALREEGDCKPPFTASTALLFLSTPSARRATVGVARLGDRLIISVHALREEGDLTCALSAVCAASSFLSTPSARRATRRSRSPSWQRCISIHALREEGDPVQRSLRTVRRISIHALREEGDPLAAPKSPQREISIHALREEGDFRHRRVQEIPRDFYPRPPRGGRRGRLRLYARITKFLSTPSARRATLRWMM